MKPYDDAHWAKVTLIHNGALAEGNHKVGVAVAEAFGVPRSTAHRWIKAARVRGIIGRVTDENCPYCGASPSRFRHTPGAGP